MGQGFAKGDAWVYLVVAHEWAHAIQNRLSESSQSVSAELQSDCLAAAVLYGSASDEELQFEEGDEKEIVRALSDLADELPWTSSADHGNAFQRVDAFSRGRSGGVESCVPSS
jgi:predicted metalloprotease